MHPYLLQSHSDPPMSSQEKLNKVTPAGNKSEPSSCNTLETGLKPTCPTSFADDLNLELASFPSSFFSRHLGKFCLDCLSYPTRRS